MKKGDWPNPATGENVQTKDVSSRPEESIKDSIDDARKLPLRSAGDTSLVDKGEAAGVSGDDAPVTVLSDNGRAISCPKPSHRMRWNEDAIGRVIEDEFDITNSLF